MNCNHKETHENNHEYGHGHHRCHGHRKHHHAFKHDGSGRGEGCHGGHGRHERHERRKAYWDSLNQTPEGRLLFLLNRSSHMLRHRRGRRIGQERVLTILNEQGPIAQRDLQEALEIRSASLSELLKKMEQAELIVRKESETDKRKIDINLTEKGKTASQDLSGERSEFAKELFAVLDEDERQQLTSLLEKLTAAWDMSGERRKRCSHKNQDEIIEDIKE